MNTKYVLNIEIWILNNEYWIRSNGKRVAKLEWWIISLQITMAMANGKGNGKSTINRFTIRAINYLSKYDNSKFIRLIVHQYCILHVLCDLCVYAGHDRNNSFLWKFSFRYFCLCWGDSGSIRNAHILNIEYPNIICKS